jgi:hypothetical protein
MPVSCQVEKSQEASEMTTSFFESFVKNAANLSDLKAALRLYHPTRCDEWLKIWTECQDKDAQERARLLVIHVEESVDRGLTESEMLQDVPASQVLEAIDLWAEQMSRYEAWEDSNLTIRTAIQSKSLTTGWMDDAARWLSEAREVNG